MQNMASETRHGGKYCVAGVPNNTSCTNGQFTEGISLHVFPNVNKEPERHWQWVRFVRRHRPGWKPSGRSILCGVHFEEKCFDQNKVVALSLGKKLRLKPDAVPTVDVANKSPVVEHSMTHRQRRKVFSFWLCVNNKIIESLIKSFEKEFDVFLNKFTFSYRLCAILHESKQVQPQKALPYQSQYYKVKVKPKVQKKTVALFPNSKRDREGKQPTHTAIGRTELCQLS